MLKVGKLIRRVFEAWFLELVEVRAALACLTELACPRRLVHFEC